MASMVSFLKRNPNDEGNKEALNARSEERLEYLATYVAHQAKKHKSTIVTEESQTHNESVLTDHHQWNFFMMCKEVGESTAKLWVDSKKLEYVGDRITGSDLPDTSRKHKNKYYIYIYIYIIN